MFLWPTQWCRPHDARQFASAGGLQGRCRSCTAHSGMQRRQKLQPRAWNIKGGVRANQRSRPATNGIPGGQQVDNTPRHVRGEPNKFSGYRGISGSALSHDVGPLAAIDGNDKHPCYRKKMFCKIASNANPSEWPPLRAHVPCETLNASCHDSFERPLVERALNCAS